MRPILNVPDILIPGETLLITAQAPQTTTLWNAALLHGAKRINLQVFSPLYDPNFGTWNLQAIIPDLPVYELYDLELTASGNIYDVTKNAVQVLPTRKNSYYFMHITDLHLPNRIFYPNAGYDVDSLEVNDFRAVIEDINLIRPEFVLITGDLINEGELEGIAGQYWFGWTQRLLGLIEVPIYVVSGNHDIGGWDRTPGSQGSARRNWWRYFGWPWLNTTSSSSNTYTQDFSFRYGDIRYIGLETYINYDRWRYNIYGNNGLISSQWQWLNLELASAPDTKAMFYHYDFDEEFELSELGVELALWGHTHSNSGSIYTQPYNLSTRSVCSGNRAYRMIKVNNNSFSPQNTMYAGNSGTGIYEYYLPSNTGEADSVMCVITNNQYMSFDQGLIKFVMPLSDTGYNVTGGILEQIDRSGSHNICYVRVNMMANTTRYISITATGVDNDDPAQTPAPLKISTCYPNPFAREASIVLNLPYRQHLELSIYNSKGQKIRSLHSGAKPAGKNILIWDGRDDSGAEVASGIYFIRAHSEGGSVSRKLVKRAISIGYR